ncbi:MAG: tRNA (adenosine(37)-N6)-threonylcarbamoyltransferase complex dimerization subunit type 1 TsaB [Cocleimonas sp.]
MANILAIETATEACSAALLIDNGIEYKLHTRFQLAPREHTQLILPMLDEILEEGSLDLSDVNAIAFGRGPGAFTGLRIAAGVAQGIALSIDKPMIPVSTLQALAYQAFLEKGEDKTVIAALDARMSEVYWGVFKLTDSKVHAIKDEKVSKAQEMLSVLTDTTHIGVGSAWDEYYDDLFSDEEPQPDALMIMNGQLPRAEYIARLALDLYKNNKTVAIEDAQPVYIRNNVAVKSNKSGK